MGRNQLHSFKPIMKYLEKKETILFIVASKTIKHSEINVIKEAKDLCNKKYKTLLKIKTKGDTKKWKDIPQ